MTDAGDELHLVTFRLDKVEFAFTIFHVERVLRYQVPEPLPSAPAFLDGVLPHDGAMIPVVDLRKRINLPAPVNDETRILVVELEQERIGVVVDAVREVLRVSAEHVMPPPPLVRGLAAQYITGILRLDGRTVVVLAAPKLLTSTERLALNDLLAEIKP